MLYIEWSEDGTPPSPPSTSVGDATPESRPTCSSSQRQARADALMLRTDCRATWAIVVGGERSAPPTQSEMERRSASLMLLCRPRTGTTLRSAARHRAGPLTSPRRPRWPPPLMQSDESPGGRGRCRLSPKNMKRGTELRADKVRNKKEGRRVLKLAPCSASDGASRSAAGRRRLCCTCTCSRARWAWPAGGTGTPPAGAARSRRKSPRPVNAARHNLVIRLTSRTTF